MSEKDKEQDKDKKKGLFGKAIDAISSRDEKEALEKALKERDEAQKATQQAISREKMATAQAKIAAQKEVEEAQKRAADAEARLKRMEMEQARQKHQAPLPPKDPRAVGDFSRQDFATAPPKFLAEHTIGPDETLSHIALKYYGHSTRDYFMVIYEANKEAIGDNPGIVRPGTVLHIPELPANLKGK